MRIRYNLYIPVNIRFLLCVMLVLLLWVGMALLDDYEENVKVVFYALFSFWSVWFVYEAMQNRTVKISSITLDSAGIIVTAQNQTYTFSFAEIEIDEIFLGCIKTVNIANRFYLNSIYIHTKDFIEIEKRVWKYRDINSSTLQHKLLLFVSITVLIIVLSEIFHIGFDAVLYSLIGIYLLYQAGKK